MQYVPSPKVSINIITEGMKIERFYISERTIHGRKNIISDKNYY